MNFFDAQDQARRTSRRLVFFYIVAVGIIVIGVTLIIGFSLYGFTDVGRSISVRTFLVQYAPMLLGIAALVTMVIVFATAYKTASLSSGGSRVAAGDTDLEITLADGERQEILSLEPLPEGGWAARSSEREAILVLDEAVSGAIGQKLSAVRAAEPLGTGDPAPATENLDISGDESQE